MKRVLTCIGCPMGCMLDVTVDNGQVATVTGNLCARGTRYAQEEIASPTRMLTTVVPITGASRRTVAVKTSESVPKESMFACMAALRDVSVQAPVHMGDVLVQNLASTGISLVAANTIL